MSEYSLLGLCLLLLDRHYFLDATYRVELLDVPPELARFDLSVVQKVLYEETHHLSRSILDHQSLLERVHN